MRWHVWLEVNGKVSWKNIQFKLIYVYSIGLNHVLYASSTATVIHALIIYAGTDEFYCVTVTEYITMKADVCREFPQAKLPMEGHNGKLFMLCPRGFGNTVNASMLNGSIQLNSMAVSYYELHR